MKRRRHSAKVKRVGLFLVCLAALCETSCSRLARPHQAYVPFPQSRTSWHGYERHDFVVAGSRVIVVTPARVAAGVPWVWRASFFGQRSEVEVALLAAGLHVVYMDVTDLCGSPAAMARWDALYDLLTREHGFSSRPALTAISRGGLIAYNWAAAHPERVACVFADMPVCDFKSWPGGFGRAERDPDQWKKCLVAYGFDEAQALRFEGNPVDQLEPLARAGVPLLHAQDPADPIVPFSENTGLLAERYEHLGGAIDVILKNGRGHVAGVESPQRVIDFLVACGAP